MLRKMTGHANHLFGELQNPLEVRIGEIESGLRHVLLGNLAAPTAPHGAREHCRHLFG